MELSIENKTQETPPLSLSRTDVKKKQAMPFLHKLFWHTLVKTTTRPVSEQLDVASGEKNHNPTS